MNPTTELITDAEVVADSVVVRHGWVLVEDGVIADVGPASQRPPTAGTTTSVAGASLLPGFVDIHVHGGGGGSFGADLESCRRAAEFHAAAGTTSLLAGLSTSPPSDLLDQLSQLGRVEDWPEGSRLLGIHLEGPYISAIRKGAHDPKLIRPPDASELASLLATAAGRVRLLTAAPEIAGFDDLARVALDAGVVVSAGHTDAEGSQLLAAVAAGARSLTHTFNGMRPINHRVPGPLEAIVDSDVFCELICDGVHVHPAIVRMLRRLAGPHRVVLITDAVAWAGYPDGEYESIRRQVQVRDGGVYLRGTDTLAGSTLTMAEAARRYVRFTGAGMAEVAAVTSTNAARVLGEDHRIGRIRRGHRADLVVLDRAMQCMGVMRDGRWVKPFGPRGGPSITSAEITALDGVTVGGCPCHPEASVADGDEPGRKERPGQQ